MKKSAFCFFIAALLLALCFSAQAQQEKKTPVIGYLTLASSQRQNEQTFERGLRELGYIQGKNISIEWRFAGGKVDRLPVLAADLVKVKPNVIVTGSGYECALAVKNATTMTPTVFINITDPVDLGLVKSFAHPAGNITGLSNFLLELPGKQIELIKELIPRVSRVGVISPPLSTPGTKMDVKELEAVAGSLRVMLQVIDRQEQAESAFELAKKNRIDAFIILPSALLVSETQRLIDLALKNGLATIHTNPIWVERGGLMSYGPDFTALYHRAAVYVDKILKGANPADLPVERPTKFELAINLKTAKQIGLTIPPNVLARADKVIR
jgi:putative ABC transport system substrate-binding protein